jgi:hypothetical protein
VPWLYVGWVAALAEIIAGCVVLPSLAREELRSTITNLMQVLASTAFAFVPSDGLVHVHVRGCQSRMHRCSTIRRVHGNHWCGHGQGLGHSLSGYASHILGMYPHTAQESSGDSRAASNDGAGANRAPGHQHMTTSEQAATKDRVQIHLGHTIHPSVTLQHNSCQCLTELR